MIIDYDPRQAAFLCKCGTTLQEFTDFDPSDAPAEAPDADSLWAAGEADLHRRAPAHDRLAAVDGAIQAVLAGACAAAPPRAWPANPDSYDQALRYDTDRQAFLCKCGVPLTCFVDYPDKGVSMTDPDALWAVDEADIEASLGGEPRHDVLQVDGLVEWAAYGACLPQP